MRGRAGTSPSSSPLRFRTPPARSTRLPVHAEPLATIPSRCLRRLYRKHSFQGFATQKTGQRGAESQQKEHEPLGGIGSQGQAG